MSQNERKCTCGRKLQIQPTLFFPCKLCRKIRGQQSEYSCFERPDYGRNAFCFECPEGGRNASHPRGYKICVGCAGLKVCERFVEHFMCSGCTGIDRSELETSRKTMEFREKWW